VDPLKEKKWKHLCWRSNKLRRAQQLGMDEPRKTARHRTADKPIHVLFVCSRNQWRSPTGERIYRDHPRVNTRSAGTAVSARHPVTPADIQWADLILVMERKHHQRLRADFPEALRFREVRVLGIEDRHRFMAPELVAELRLAVDPILAEMI